MRSLGWILCSLVLRCSFCWADDQQHHHELTKEEVGSVHFSISCKAEVQPDFNRAVALLHSFQYEGARQAFEAIRQKDPACAMAHWGVAMSHYHGLWDNSDLTAGREALRKAQKVAAENSACTRREKAYIEALGEIYREDGKDLYAHAIALERAMGTLQAAHPEDTEAAIFHALTLDITAPKTDSTYSNQRKCGEILEPIFEKLLNHPGAVHYLIHCYDNPALAQQGLKAARVYAKIAPASAHAHHMPSHIFTRLGLWEESVQSNRRSEGIAAAAETTSKNGEARDQRLHAMDYMEYAFLQSGRVSDAKDVISSMNALPPATGLTMIGDYALAAIPARNTMELAKWEEATALVPRRDAVPWAQAITWTAIGIGAARSGHLEQAAEAEHRLEELRDATAKLNTYWSKQVAVQVQEVKAWIAQQSGEGAKALTLMTAGADLEESMDKHAVTPGQIVPAREMLGQMLLEQKQPADALSAFEAVLKVAPKRFNALYGAGKAAEAAGNAAVAQRYYQELLDVGVSNERPEIEAARKKVQVAAKK